MNVDERSDARERALHLLYEAQSKGISVEEVIGAQVVEPDELVLVLARGAELASNRADELIEGKSRGWTLQRMPVIDVAIMRMALFELLERADVPTAWCLMRPSILQNGFPPTTAVGSSTECWQRLPPRCETDETMAPESRSGPTRSLRDHCCLHRVLRIADAQHPPRPGHRCI